MIPKVEAVTGVSLTASGVLGAQWCVRASRGSMIDRGGQGFSNIAFPYRGWSIHARIALLLWSSHTVLLLSLQGRYREFLSSA